MQIIPAILSWPNGQPFSTQFNDVYFMRNWGLDEARYVYLAQNDLPARFKQSTAFTLFETGFGTGLNFLATWQAWEQLADPKAALHYISVEKHPLCLADLKQALSLWPELSSYVEQLIAQYPLLECGQYDLLLAPNVTLSLLWGDAHDWLPKLECKINAWYLDGFAPKHNQDLWQEGLFQEMLRLSLPGSTFSTFTAVSQVRYALTKAGFTVKKTKGFRWKKHMLCGYCYWNDLKV